jgi:hypothetical protein
MRISLVLTAAGLALAWAAPANAQMCGPGQTTGSTASTPGQTGGMGCPMMRPSAGADAEQRSGMCPMMAMMMGRGMGGIMGGGMTGGGMQHAPQTPSPSAPQPTPGTPETPRPQ